MAEIGQSAGKSFAYIVGVYLGDGCVTKSGGRPVFRLGTIDADFAQTVKATLTDMNARWVSLTCHAVKKSSKPNHSLAARHDDLCRRLVEITEGKKRLPDGIDDWPREDKIAFIAGLMDSEGFVGEQRGRANRKRHYMGYKSCDPWVPHFIRILESVGVRIGRIGIEEPLKPWYKTPQRFTIKMQSWIDAGCYFNIQRKQERVKIWAAMPPRDRRAEWAARRLTSETLRQTPA